MFRDGGTEFCCSIPHWVRRGKLVCSTSPISSSGHDFGGQSSTLPSERPQKTPTPLSDSFTCLLLPPTTCPWSVQDTHFLYLASKSTVALGSCRLSPEVENRWKCVQNSHTHLWFALMAHGHFQVRGLPVCVLGDRDTSWWCRRPHCPSRDTPSALQSMCLVIWRDPSICIPQFSHLSVKWGAYARCIDRTDSKQVFSWEQFWFHSSARMKVSSLPGRDRVLGKCSCATLAESWLSSIPGSASQQPGREGTSTSPTLRVFCLPWGLDPHKMNQWEKKHAYLIQGLLDVKTS